MFSMKPLLVRELLKSKLDMKASQLLPLDKKQIYDTIMAKWMVTISFSSLIK